MGREPEGVEAQGGAGAGSGGAGEVTKFPKGKVPARRGKVEVWVVREASKPVIERRRLKIDKGMLVDGWNSKSYAITSDPLLVFEGRRVKEVYLCDEKTAATMNVVIERRGEKESNWKLTPHLLHSVVDSRLLQYAFAIRPERKAIFGALLLGAFLGFLVGVIFG